MAKIGRKALCPCGSGLRFEDCCSNLIIHNVIEDELRTKKVYEANARKHDMSLNVRKYRRYRALHQEVSYKMNDYYFENSDDFIIKVPEIYVNGEQIDDLKFDFQVKFEGLVGLDLLIYPHKFGFESLTELFLRKNKLHARDKIAMAEAMLASKTRLLEYVKSDEINCIHTMRDVISKELITFTDEKLGLNMDIKDFYMYLRVIQLNEIAWISGMQISFHKSEESIHDWIRNYNNSQDSTRELLELYMMNKTDSSDVKVEPWNVN